MRRKVTSKGLSYLLVSVSLLLWMSALIFMLPDANADQSANTPESLCQFGFDQTIPDDIWQAARIGLRPYLEGIPAESSEDYGFPKGAGVDDVSIEQPYRVMAIHPQELINFRSGDDIRSKLIETEMWMFPLTQHGEPRAILMVDRLNGLPQVVLFGYAELAAELLMMERLWSDQDGCTRTLIQIPQATSELLLITKGDLVEVQPLESARVSLCLEEFDESAPQLYPVAELVEELIPIVRDNIEHAKD